MTIIEPDTRAMLLLSTLLFVGCGSAKAQPALQPLHEGLVMRSKEPFRLSDESKNKLHQLLLGAVEQNHGYGGAIFRIESLESGLLWEGAVGRDSIEGSNVARQHAFEIASITKTLVAVCILLLQEQGKLNLDSSLAMYLGERQLSGLLVVHGEDLSAKITLRQALSHRSGLPDYWSDGPFRHGRENDFLSDFQADPARMWQPDELLAYVRRQNPIGAPGKKFHYSDTNYVLLGLVLERATKMPLASVFRELLFKPLGMNDTYLSYREGPPKHVNLSHRYEGHLDLFARAHQSADWAGGGLVSTTSDLTKFMAALERGTLFRSTDSLRQMRSWKSTNDKGIDYGLGLFRVVLPGHGGHIEGHDGHGNSWLYYWSRCKVILSGTLNQTDNDWWPLVKKSIGVLERECSGE